MVDHEAEIRRIRDELDDLQRRSADEMRAQQDRRLASLVRFHLARSLNPAYREFLRAHGVEHEDDLPRSVAELARLPITSRAFLQESNYAARPCVPPEEVQKVIETSGTSGNPLRLPYTYEMTRRSYQDLLARAFIIGGVDPLVPSYWVVHWEPGGKDDWSSHLGARSFEALAGEGRALVASTRTAAAEHWQCLAAHRPRWAVSAPVFFMAFAAYCEHEGLDLASCSLQRLMLGGATCLPEDRAMIRRAYGAEHVHMFYPSTEALVMGSELPDGSGYVCFEDEVLVDVVDAHGLPVKIGERGRVLLTYLCCRGFPVIRYAIGDAATYLGAAPGFPGFKLIADINRIDAGEIGEARLPFSEIELMPRQFLGRGVPVRAFQIARRRLGVKDVPVFRIETAVADRATIERIALDVFTQNPQMKDMLDSGMIHAPAVELYPPGGLTRGRFKVPLYVDERQQQYEQ
ncbi:MAG: phenylacetate--CoA ligase family protein [Chloroflexi bacterium]|nr:phenylacetate--CoA ligase family protein [Chloroflexota bacterium]